MTHAAHVRDAYQLCEEITRTQARNFSYGIRLLPEPKRHALSAVYAFARRIDDIGDGDLPQDVKLARLADARRDIRTPDLESTDPVLVALADASARMPIPMDAFEELIDGCEADVRGVRYGTIDELVHYCRCVAGSVGRLSLGVFGASPDGPDGADRTAVMAAASREADALGVALQLTNILRDVLEDRRDGRVYLPAEDLDRFGVRLELTAAGELAGDGVSEPVYTALVRFEADRAERWYADGLRLLPRLDRRSRACCAAMAGIYHRLLHRIAADPTETMRSRMSLTSWQKATVAARSLAGMTS
jgi:phytoene synthase